MTKQETVDHLRGLKYQAELVKGVVVIFVDAPMSRRQKERLRTELKTIGYKGSWGWRMKGVTE
jgi:hypothetical protein